MDKGRLTYYAAKKFDITRRTIYRWIENGVEPLEIEKKMREVGSDTLIKPQVAAEMIGITKQTIYRWVKVGKVECYELFFNVVRFSKNEILKRKDKVT